MDLVEGRAAGCAEDRGCDLIKCDLARRRCRRTLRRGGRENQRSTVAALCPAQQWQRGSNSASLAPPVTGVLLETAELLASELVAAAEDEVADI